MVGAYLICQWTNRKLSIRNGSLFIFLLQNKCHFMTLTFFNLLINEQKCLFDLFAFLLSQFIWAEFVNKHFYWRDIICHSHCHCRSCIICPLNREYAGIGKRLLTCFLLLLFLFCCLKSVECSFLTFLVIKYISQMMFVETY